MGKQIMVHLYYKILLSDKKEQTSAIHSNTNDSQKHYTSKISQTQKTTLFDSTNILFLKGQNYRKLGNKK